MNFEVQGYQKLIHPDTGESYSVLMNEIKGETSDLNRFILKQMINSLNLKHKRLDVANWIIDNMDDNYCLYASQRVISMKLNCSLKTVYYTLRDLQAAKIIEKIENLGCLGYKINPILICKDENISSIGICYKKKEKK